MRTGFFLSPLLLCGGPKFKTHDAIALQMDDMAFRKRNEPNTTPSKPQTESRQEIQNINTTQNNLAIDVDSVDYFGANPNGGVQLTRQGIENARGVTTPIFVAEQKLQQAVNNAGGKPPKEAFQSLLNAIGAASDAGVSERAPQMLRAASLAQAFERAIETSVAQESVPPDPLVEKLDLLFDEGYSIPDLDPDLL